MRIQEAAEAICGARLGRQQMDALPHGLEPTTLEEGYAIGSAVTARLGRPTGWKLAATSASSHQRLGIDHPLIGRLYGDRAMQTGVVADPDFFLKPIAEPEFVVEIGELPSHAPVTDDDLLAAIASVRLGIEVPESRFVDLFALSAPMVVADNAFDGSYVLGPLVQNWRALDLSLTQVLMRKNGEVVERGSGAMVGGGPLVAFRWFLREIRTRSLSVDRGEIVFTGTCTRPVPMAAGDEVVAEFEGLGEVRISLS